MPGLKAVTNDLNSIDQNLRGFYAEHPEQKGLFVLNVEQVGGWALEDVADLKGGLTKERARADKAEASVKAWSKALGDDATPDKIKKNLDKLGKLESFDPDKEAEKLAEEKVKARLDAAASKHAEELGEWKSKHATLEQEHHLSLVDNEAATALSLPDTKGSHELLKPVFRERTKVITDEQTGKRRVVVVDDAGNPRVKNAKGDLFTVADLAAELKGDPLYARAFDGTSASGSGAGATKPGQRLPGGQPLIGKSGNAEQLSPIQKISQGLQQRAS